MAGWTRQRGRVGGLASSFERPFGKVQWAESGPALLPTGGQRMALGAVGTGRDRRKMEARIAFTSCLLRLWVAVGRTPCHGWQGTGLGGDGRCRRHPKPILPSFHLIAALEQGLLDEVGRDGEDPAVRGHITGEVDAEHRPVAGREDGRTGTATPGPADEVQDLG